MPRSEYPDLGLWPDRSISRVMQGTVRIPNNNDDFIHICKSQYIAQIRRVVTPPSVIELPKTLQHVAKVST